MKKTLILTLLFLSMAANAANLNSLVINQKGQFTQLLPEISGLEYESGYFGTAVAVDGEYMVVGAARAFFGGAAAVYRKSSGQWELMQMLDYAGFQGTYYFGGSVDISGDNMVIGASGHPSVDDNGGAVLFYQLIDGVWQHAQTILSPQPRELGGFGAKVVLKGDRLLVAETFGVNQSGMFYTYTLNSSEWQLEKTIDDMDLEPQLGTSKFNIDFDESHVVLSRSQSGSSGSLLRVYDLTDDSLSDFQTLQPNPASQGFGNALSLDGNRLVVADDTLNFDTGVVYFYEKTNGQWQLQQTIERPDQDQDEGFGSAVQLKDDQLLIGSYRNNEIAGEAGAVFYYQFVGGQWLKQQKILASNGAELDNFGSSAALDGNELVISATRAENEIRNAGKVYSFQLSNERWIEKQIIEPLPANNDSIFSNALALNDQWVVVGADGDNDMGEDAGAVYLYKKSQGSLSFVEKIYAEQPGINQQFGKNIVIEGDVMLIAATGNLLIDGDVHYYRLMSDQWTYQSKFKPNDILPTDRFGYGLSIDDGLLAVSATYQVNETDTGENNTGAVYIFERQDNLWVEQQKLSFSSENEVDSFGFDLSLAADRLAVSTLFTGKVFLFENNNDSWTQTHELSHPDAEPPFAFGRSVNLVNNQLIVSAGYNSPLVYNFNGSEISAPIMLDDAIEGTQIVRDIDTNNDWLVMTGSGLNGASEAYVYQFIDNAWQFVHTLSKPIFGTNYVNDVTVYQDEVLVGDFGNSQRGLSNGAAYWVKDLADANLKISQGLNGSWYNTETSGQGLFLDVMPSRNFSFMGLFTYDTMASSDDTLGQIGAEGQRWLVGEGVIDPINLTINYQLYYSHDGLFDNSRETMTINPESYGVMSIKFESCTEAEVSYEIFAAGLSNTYSIQRPIAGSGELCDSFANDISNDPSSPPSFDDRLNGAWYNPETSGQGLFIDKFKGTDAAFMGWFTYDTVLPEGISNSQIGTQGQRWLVGTGETDPNNINILNYDLYYTSGGLFDDPMDPVVEGLDGYGNLRIEFIDCAHANVTYEIVAEGLSGSYSVIKALSDTADCNLDAK